MDHEQHMAKVKAGLEQILASEDINEIKMIAEALLQEEAAEMQAESQPSLKEKFQSAMAQPQE